MAQSTHIKNTAKDSAWHSLINRQERSSGQFDLSIDRISKTIIQKPESLLFRLNPVAIQSGGDTLTLVDTHTGAVAKASQNKTTRGNDDCGTYQWRQYRPGS